MQTVILDIKDDKINTFLTILKNLKSDLIESVDILDNSLDIEPIEKESLDFQELQKIKEQNNTKYSLSESKKILGF